MYRDVFADRRDRWQGASFANFAGHLEYDRRVLHDFSWGAWFWNPDKALGMPRFGEVLNRPLYPVHLLVVALLPTLTAWHWITIFHVLLKLVGLVLLGVELRWPLWLVVLASAGAMLTHGALLQFGDVIDLAAAAWLPLQLWLTVKAVRGEGWSRWDGMWVVCAVFRFLGSNPNRLLYYELLVISVAAAFAWGRLRQEAVRMAGRYALTLAIAAPLVLPAFISFAESARTHFLQFDDWHFRRAYNWQNYWLHLSDLTDGLLVPWGVWAALAVAVAVVKGSVGPLTISLGAYLGFALLHNIHYAPFWFALAVLPGVRIPQKAFEPITWLMILGLAEIAAWLAHDPRRPRRRALAIALMAGGLASAAWQTPLDPRTAYVWPRWTRPLPEALAATIKAEPRAQVLLATGTERVTDDRQPLLNSNHNFFLGIPSARFFGDVPTYAFMRATYRVPGLLLIQRMPTPVHEWEAIIDLYAELGIRWVLWDGEDDPVHPRLAYVAEEQGVRLYEITGAQPLISAVSTLRAVDRPRTPSAVADLVYALPSRGSFCYGCPQLPAPVGEAKAALLNWRWRPGAVEVDVDSAQTVYVVLRETFSSRWRATVDGTTVPIYQVDEVFQAVSVRPGHHVVAWQFHEPSFFIGVGVAAVGLTVLVAAPWLRRPARA